MTDQLIISAYGSHNGTISMYYNGKYHVVEVERWLNNKNIGITSYMPCSNPQIVFDEITDWLLAKTDGREVDVYIQSYLNAETVVPKFKYKSEYKCDHHSSHAAAAFYQSPYDKSIIFSTDGGGDGSFWNVYLADRVNGIKLLHKLDYDLGFPYMLISDNLADIKRDPLSIGNLVYAGKKMGLVSYGNTRQEWLPHFLNYYSKFKYTGESYIGGLEARSYALPELMKNIGVEDFDMETSRLEGQAAWDIAATSQKAFEEFFLQHASKFLEEYSDLPVCMSGGCALNVLFNSKLLEMRNGKVFVPPNVNDCGISVGSILHYLKPQQQVDLTYSGLPVMDAHEFGNYLQDSSKYFVYENVEIKELAEFIADGNIVGLIQGNSEHGSRALGNRSIICNPIEGMKDTLNHKVKNREWYRPFAPIVRLEDANKYFEFPYNTESRHMTFVANVREEYRGLLPAITHADNTARLQTVTRPQNALIYDLITEFEKITGHAVILNTSFNVNGKPILTRLSDAFLILDKTELDAIYFNNCLVFRKGNERKFKRSPVFSNKKVMDGHTTYLWATKSDKITKANIKAAIKSSSVDNLTVITTDDTTTIIHKFVYEQATIANKPVHVHNISTNRMYVKNRDKPYTNFIQAYEKIRLLWTKEILNENTFLSEYHAFIDASISNDSFNKILKDYLPLTTNKEFLVCGKRENVFTVFDEAFITKKANKIADYSINADFFGGHFERVQNLSNDYEAVLLWYTNLGKIADLETDYITLVSSEKPYNYRLIDL